MLDETVFRAMILAVQANRHLIEDPLRLAAVLVAEGFSYREISQHLPSILKSIGPK